MKIVLCKYDTILNDEVSKFLESLQRVKIALENRRYNAMYMKVHVNERK